MHPVSGIRPKSLVISPSLWTRAYRANPVHRKPFQGPKGHGEKIWVFCHRKTQQIIYSFNERLDGLHSLKQLPFNGKKTKPAKLRKDYWSPMALIEFPQGKGNVGRDVFQKLRELKHLHEVSWGDEIANKTVAQYTKEERDRVNRAKANHDETPVFKRSKKQRGMALNARKPFTIADMAAVLAGAGRGNLMWTAEKGADGPQDGAIPTERGEEQLLPVSIMWANDGDMNMAQRWTLNVNHHLMEQPEWKSTESPLRLREETTLLRRDDNVESSEGSPSMPRDEFVQESHELGNATQDQQTPKKKSVFERLGF